MNKEQGTVTISLERHNELVAIEKAMKEKKYMKELKYTSIAGGSCRTAETVTFITKEEFSKEMSDQIEELCNKNKKLKKELSDKEKRYFNYMTETVRLTRDISRLKTNIKEIKSHLSKRLIRKIGISRFE